MRVIRGFSELDMNVFELVFIHYKAEVKGHLKSSSNVCFFWFSDDVIFRKCLNTLKSLANRECVFSVECLAVPVHFDTRKLDLNLGHVTVPVQYPTSKPLSLTSHSASAGISCRKALWM